MKMETKPNFIGSSNAKPIQMAADAAVSAKLVSLLTKSQYAFSYSAIRELWLNARENDQDTIELHGYEPKKTVIKLPSDPMDHRSHIDHQDGTIFGALGSADTDVEPDLVYGNQEWFASAGSASQSFSIRNYGHAMNAEEFEDRVSMAGSSSKSESDNRGGGMGIGILSPMSITDRALFENFRDGKVTYISIFRDSNGVISAEEPYSTDTDEEDGMRVSFDISHGVDLQSIFRDIIETFTLVGKSESIQVHCDASTVRKMEESIRELTWINDKHTYGWNFAICPSYNSINTDRVLIDGCMYRTNNSNFIAEEIVNTSHTISSYGSQLKIIGFYNARVGELEPSTSREYVQKFEQTVEAEDYPFDIQEIRNVFSNASVKSDDPDVTPMEAYSNTVADILASLDSIGTPIARCIADDVRENGVDGLKLSDSVKARTIWHSYVHPFPVRITNNSKATVKQMYVDGKSLRLSRFDVAHGMSDSYFAIKHHSTVNIHSIQTRLRRIAGLSGLRDIIEQWIEDNDISVNSAVMDFLFATNRVDGYYVKSSSVELAFQPELNYESVSFDTADNLSISTLDVIDYSEIDAAIKNIRTAWKTLGYAPEKTSSSPRSEVRYEMRLYGGPETPFENGNTMQEMSVSEIVDYLDAVDVDVEDKRVLVIEDDDDMGRIIRDDDLREFLFLNYGYSVYVFTTTKQQKVSVMADRLSAEYEEVYFTSYEDLFDRTEYAEFIMDKADELIQSDNFDGFNVGEPLAKVKSLSQIMRNLDEDAETRIRWKKLLSTTDYIESLYKSAVHVKCNLNHSLEVIAAAEKSRSTALAQLGDGEDLTENYREKFGKVTEKMKELQALIANI